MSQLFVPLSDRLHLGIGKEVNGKILALQTGVDLGTPASAATSASPSPADLSHTSPINMISNEAGDARTGIILDGY